MKQHPYWNKPNKVHPELKQVREEAGALTEAQQKKVDDAKKSEELRQERKRDRFFRKHGKVEPDPIIAQVNITDGVRLGRKDAKIRETELKFPINTVPVKYKNFGRVSRQSDIGKSGVRAGYTDAMKDFEKAYNPSPNGAHRDKPAKAKPEGIQEVQSLAARTEGYYVVKKQ